MTTTESATPVLTSSDEALATARALAAEIAAGAVERELGGVWPEEQLRQVGRSGLLGITVPVEHGGPGLSHATAALLVRPRHWT